MINTMPQYTELWAAYCSEDNEYSWGRIFGWVVVAHDQADISSAWLNPLIAIEGQGEPCTLSLDSIIFSYHPTSDEAQVAAIAACTHWQQRQAKAVTA